MSYARGVCACCGGNCPSNCGCDSTTRMLGTSGCLEDLTGSADQWDSRPYDCGAKPFSFTFTFGNNGGSSCSPCDTDLYATYNGWDTNVPNNGAKGCTASAGCFGWSITATINGIFNGLDFDYEASGWKKWQAEGYEFCDEYMYKIGYTTASDCCDDCQPRRSCNECGYSSFLVNAYALSTDADGNTIPRLEAVEVDDADDYNALDISYFDDEDNTSYVRMLTQGKSLKFEWVGGAYDGEECTIDVHDNAGNVAACINAMNKGVSAVALTNDFIGCCHRLKLQTWVNINHAGTHRVEYNKTRNKMYWKFTLGYIVFPNLGDGADHIDDWQDVWGGTNDCDTAIIIPPSETGRTIIMDSEDELLEMCQCQTDMPYDQYYCANWQTYTLTPYPTSSDCDGMVKSMGYSNCSSSAACFTWNEGLTWT